MARAETIPTTTDPIFALIDAERAARKAWNRVHAEAPKGCDPDPGCLIPAHDAEIGAVAAVLKTLPTTLRGVIEAIEWTLEAERDDAPLRDDWYQDFLKRMALALKIMTYKQTWRVYKRLSDGGIGMVPSDTPPFPADEYIVLIDGLPLQEAGAWVNNYRKAQKERR